MFATYEISRTCLYAHTQKQYFYINEQPIPFVTILVGKIYHTGGQNLPNVRSQIFVAYNYGVFEPKHSLSQ